MKNWKKPGENWRSWQLQAGIGAQLCSWKGWKLQSSFLPWRRCRTLCLFSSPVVTCSDAYLSSVSHRSTTVLAAKLHFINSSWMQSAPWFCFPFGGNWPILAFYHFRLNLEGTGFYFQVLGVSPQGWQRLFIPCQWTAARAKKHKESEQTTKAYFLSCENSPIPHLHSSSGRKYLGKFHVNSQRDTWHKVAPCVEAILLNQLIPLI